MPTLGQLQLPPPASWDAFEALCCSLWRRIWNDLNAKRHGRQGQSQDGVDVVGRLSPTGGWAGVQCRLKDRRTERRLTEKELRKEVNKAKSFVPQLSQFIVATTAPRDANIQRVARALSDEHRQAGLFAVDVWSWDDIVERLAEFPDVVSLHYPGLAQLATLNPLSDQLTAFLDMHEQPAKASDQLKPHAETPISKAGPAKAYDPHACLETYHERAIDAARDHLTANKPGLALELLRDQKELIWSHAASETRARLLMAQGAAHLALVEEKAAAECFLEAIQYSPDDEKVLCNGAIAYLLLDDHRQAGRLARRVLKRNPANYQAHAVAIQATHRPLSRILRTIPGFCKVNRDVAFALGAVARRQDDLDQAVHWFRLAADGNERILPDIKASLAETLLERLQSDKRSPIHIRQLPGSLRSQLLEIDELYSDSWSALGEDESRRPRVAWIVNRAIVRWILGKTRDAESDILEAQRLVPRQPVAKFLSASIADEHGDSEIALELAKEIAPSEDLPHLPLFVAAVLLRAKGPEESLDYLKASLERGVPKGIQPLAMEMLVEAYERAGKLDDALEQCADMLTEEPSNVRLHVRAAAILRKKSDPEAADMRLVQAMTCLHATTPPLDALILGDELYDLNRFEDAAKVYERIAITYLDTPLTRRFLYACYRAGFIGKALEGCNQLRINEGAQYFVGELEAVIYEELGDLNASRRACESCLAAKPNDTVTRIRLAVIHLRQRNYLAVDAFLADLPAWELLSPGEAIQVGNILTARERYREATELLYRVRRRHANGDLDLHYLFSVCFHGNDRGDWLRVSEVGPASAVCVEDPARRRQWFVLEDIDTPDSRLNEIGRSHCLWNELLGRRIGNRILLKEGTLAPEYGTIVEIQSKYVRAFHESGQTLQTRYPNVRGFEAIHVPKDDEERRRVIVQHAETQAEFRHTAFRVYQEHQIPIGVLAELLGQSIVEAQGALLGRVGVKLACNTGRDEDLKQALGVIARTPRPTLLVDPIALMTIDHCGIRDEVRSIVGRFGVVQATIDLFTETLYKAKAIQRGGFWTLAHVRGRFVGHEVAAADVERHLAWLEDTLAWIDGNCDVVSIPVSVRATRQERRQLSQLIGEASAHSVLAAAGEDRILYSDDLWLRVLAKMEYGVDGIWTQAILWYARENGGLARGRYDEAVIALATAGFAHIAVDGQILVAAARKDRWRPGQSFDAVLNSLRAPECDEKSAIEVAATFLAELCKAPLLPLSFNHLVVQLLTALVEQRPYRSVLTRLESAVTPRLWLDPVALMHVRRLVEHFVAIRIL